MKVVQVQLLAFHHPEVAMHEVVLLLEHNQATHVVILEDEKCRFMQKI